jgi:hypothetical protein
MCDLPKRTPIAIVWSSGPYTSGLTMAVIHLPIDGRTTVLERNVWVRIVGVGVVELAASVGANVGSWRSHA